MRDKDTRVIEYVGRTNDPVRRQKEHARDPKKNHLDELEVKFTGLTVFEARIMEQVIISAYTLKALDNGRREIARGNLKGCKGQMDNVISLYQSALESEFLSLMER